MRCLDVAECRSILEEHVIPLDAEDGRSCNEIHSANMLIPDLAYRQRALVNVLLSHLPEGAETLLWVRQEGASWYADFAEVLHQLRLAEGDSRPLEEAPGHLFHADERELVAGVFGLVLVLGWDTLMATISTDLLISVRRGRELAIKGASLTAISALVSRLSEAGFLFSPVRRRRDLS